MKTVILPVAGKGTRLLPLTKSTPKELLPVFDKPVLQFALDEARACGATRVVVVTHSSKPSIETYLASSELQVEKLREKDKHDLADALSNAGVSSELEVRIVYQEEALGLGHAILMAAPECLDGPIGVILPDDVILGKPALCEMVAAYDGGHMVAAMPVSLEDVSKYGIFKTTDTNGPAIPATGMVEKPDPADAPSQLAAVGRYILDPVIFETLRRIPRGAGGEYQLTDAIATDLDRLSLTAFRYSGTRYDCGTHEGLLAGANARREAAPEAAQAQAQAAAPTQVAAE